MGCCTSSCEKKHDYESVGVEEDKPRNAAISFKGPVNDRSCTDVFFAILFLVCIILFVFLSIFAFVSGDIQKLVRPTDSAGKLCGIDYEDRPYLVFFDLTKCLKLAASINLSCPTQQVCVKECPKNNYYFLGKAGSYERSLAVCLDGKTANDPEYKDTDMKQLVKDGICAPYTLASAPVFGRCFPSFANKSLSMFLKDQSPTDDKGKEVTEKTLLGGSKVAMEMMQYLDAFMKHLQKNWPILIACLCVTIVACFIYIFLLRYMAKVMVWITLIAFLVIFLAATIFSFYKWNALRQIKDEVEEDRGMFNVKQYFKSSRTWLVLAILALILLIVVTSIMIFLRKQLKMAIAVIEETCKALGEMMSIVLWPLVPFLFTVAVLIYSIAVMLYLKSIVKPEMGKVDANGDAASDPRCENMTNSLLKKGCNFLGYKAYNYTIYMQIYALFMMFWLVNFIRSLDEMVLSGAYAFFYFTRLDKSQMPSFPLLKSLRNALCYHMGTLAFGSLIIALLQLIRSFLEYLSYKLKDTENPVAKFFLKCLKCCFWCLEKFLKFINRNAFIMTAIYSQNFCTAAKNAVSLIARNVMRVFVLDKVADFILFVGKLIVIAVGVGVYMFISKDEIKLPDNLISFLIIILGAYLIVTLFFSVFVMGIDTIFLCLLEDLERNDGSPEKPYWMSRNLSEAIGKRNEEIDMKEPK